MNELAVVDLGTGEITSPNAKPAAVSFLPALPADPARLPTTRLALACQQIFERREEIVGAANISEALEALQRTGAIEKYVRTKEHKDIAQRAVRVLETAVGEALGEPERGGDRRSDQVARVPVEVNPRDRERFRRMAKYRLAWWPKLQEKSLSRRQALRIIDWERRPPAKGEGSATVTRADAKKWLKGAGPADLLLTDPPYSTDVEDIKTFVSSWLGLALSRLKPTARAFIFIGAYAEEFAAYFGSELPKGWQWCVPHAWVYRNAIGPTPNTDFVRNWQCILSAKGPDASDLHSDRITELLAGFVENAPDGRQDIKHHRWEKPLPLIQRLVRVTTTPGGLVIDPFCGSGTSLLAAKAEACEGHGCDIDDTALASAVERGCRAV